jgi:alpha-glucosidase (family GH31 glycosyl hydrolase)
MTFISTQRQMQLAAEAAAKASGNSTASNPAKSGARRGSGRRRTNKWAAAASVGRVTPLDLSHRTVPMSAKGLDGTPHYDTHNLYGWAEAAATYDALAAITKKRPFVLTR